MRYIFLFIVGAIQFAHAQDDKKKSDLQFSGYLETYYLYDFNKPKNNTLPPFIYSHNRHNEINLNLGFIKTSYNSDRVRANLALMAGTYANANLAHEPGVLKNIYEANSGIKISGKKNLWVDAGIFVSHIGFETAISKNCWNLTRSISADNTPYYESGAKISYTTDNGKWFLSALILNGWQRIHRVDGNSLPSFGTQITFKPNKSTTINSSSFIGTDKPDSTRQMRYFHNLYGIFNVTDFLGITLGFNYGIEDKNYANTQKNTWYSSILISRFKLSEKFFLAIRAEFYRDANGVLIPVSITNGFKTANLSANLDYKILPNALWRIEVRNMKSEGKIFIKDKKSVASETFISTSMAVSF